MRGITQGCAFLGLNYLILTFDRYLPPPPQKKVKFCPKIEIWSENDETRKPKYIRNYQWTLKFDTML